jgi:hypothetical protein
MLLRNQNEWAARQSHSKIDYGDPQIKAEQLRNFYCLCDVHALDGLASSGMNLSPLPSSAFSFEHAGQAQMPWNHEKSHHQSAAIQSDIVEK